MRHAVLFVAVLALPSVAATQTMNAEEFHGRANALKAKGPLALLSQGEIKVLMAEGKGAAEASRANRLAAQKAGKKPRYCPPEGPQQMTSDEYMIRLSAIPQVQRRKINMTEATTRIMTAKYPCPY